MGGPGSGRRKGYSKKESRTTQWKRAQNAKKKARKDVISGIKSGKSSGENWIRIK